MIAQYPGYNQFIEPLLILLNLRTLRYDSKQSNHCYRSNSEDEEKQGNPGKFT